MRLIYGADAEVCELVNAMIRERFRPGQDRGFGVIDDNGRLVAGWVWHNWSPEAATLEFSGSALSPRWMTREILHRIFSYAFDQVGCQMVVTRNSASNTRLHRQLARFGFDRFDIPRLFGRDEDGVVFTLTDDQWRASDFYIGG